MSSTKTNFGQVKEGLIHRINCFGDNLCQSTDAITTEINFNPVFSTSTLSSSNLSATAVVLNPVVQNLNLNNDSVCNLPCNVNAQILTPDTIICSGSFLNLLGNTNNGLTFKWFINGIQVSSSINLFFNQVQPGAYQITFEADAGSFCTDVDTIDIQVLPRPAAPFLQSAIICSLDSFLIGTPALPGLTYEWSPQINLSNPFLSQTYFKPPSLNPLSYPISYLLNITNTNTGCQNTTFQNIFFQTIIQPTTSIKSVSTDFLLDQDIVLLFSRTGNNQDSIYVTRDSTGTSSPLYLGLIDNSTNEFRDLNLNTSNQIYRYYVNEKLNCINTRRTPFHQTILLRYDTVPSSGLFQLKWNKYVNWPVGVLRYEVFIRRPGETGFSLLLQTIDTSIIIPEFKQNTTFGYRVRAIRADQQASSWSNILEIRKEASLFIPNMVTMNGDGFNDLFKIENLSLYAQNQLQILNRWGRVVFKSDNYQNNWPPSDVVAGAYYYVLDLSGPDESYKGWIEVLK
jgi:gliding motility-associated-like protein